MLYGAINLFVSVEHKDQAQTELAQ